MRTTIAIDDQLLVAAKRRARERGLTLGQFIEHVVRLELARTEPPPGPPIPVSHRSGGLRPGVDVDSSRAMSDLLDGDA